METRDDARDRAQPQELDQAQVDAAGDMPAADFRAALHEVADMVADYLEGVEDYPVLPQVQPGELSGRLDGPAPNDPEPLADILRDVSDKVIPNVTHWQSPNYMAYFNSSASGIGILGELLTAGLNTNAFTWRVSPVGSELEGIVVNWLREGLGLPEGFDGALTDSASITTLAALAAARQHATGDASRSGLGERPRLRVYASTEAHSSVERALMILGIGREGFRKIPVDEDLAMRPAALREAIAEDRAAGWQPAAIVAAVGTTSTSAVDPVEPIADIAAQERLWLHMDAAYAGSTALLPEMRHHFTGWERADSMVVNPHKWMFVPIDCSLLLTRHMPVLRDALSLVPEYLRTYDGRDAGRNYSEYVPQLGRRARGIKMWMLLRYFGLSGLRARLRHHLDLAQELAGWIDADSDAELLYPVPFGLVCFRMRPSRFRGHEAEPEVRTVLNELNEQVMNELNDSGDIFLSHARIDDVFTLRLAVGSIRHERRHTERAWRLLREASQRLDERAS